LLVEKNDLSNIMRPITKKHTNVSMSKSEVSGEDSKESEQRTG
jgi:hypothetical protein